MIIAFQRRRICLLTGGVQTVIRPLLVVAKALRPLLNGNSLLNGRPLLNDNSLNESHKIRPISVKVDGIS